MNRRQLNNVFLTQILLLSVLVLPGLFAQEPDYTDLPFWRQALGGAVIGQPVAQVESVVVATDGGNLKSYSWLGSPLWDYYARGRLSPYLSRSREGTSYICRTNGVLLAVNRSGRELWALNLGSPLVFPVLTGWDGRLFIFTEGKITCLTASGYTLWSRTLEKKIAQNPVKDAHGGFIIILEDGEVLSFDPYGNAFSHLPPSIGSASATVPVAVVSLKIEGLIPVVLLFFEDRHLELIDVSMKSPLPPERQIFLGRQVPLAKFVSLRRILDLPSPPVAACGISFNEPKYGAAVLLKDGRIALISLERMEISWVADTHLSAAELSAYNLAVRPGVGDINLFNDERGIYLITKTGATGFSLDGRRLWTIRLKGAATLPTFGDDGILYSGGSDWILYAYRLEDRVKARQRLLYGEEPEGNYGLGNPGPSSLTDYYFRFSEAELLLRFNEIRQAIRNGDVGGKEPEYAAWLMETSGSLMTNIQAGNHPPVHTVHRVEAVRLLGYLGSRETIPFLAGLFRRDGEYVVKAAAAEAIGRIGIDPEGIALRAFEEAVFSQLYRREEALLTSLASAIGALCRFSGPPLSDVGVRLLTVLSSNEIPAVSRRQAQREIRSLTN